MIHVHDKRVFNCFDLFTEPNIGTAETMNRMAGVSLISHRVSGTSLVVVFLILDICILMCRMACTVDTCQQILDGCIIEKTYSDKYSE